MIEIFDFDGVLVNSLEAHGRFYHDFGRKRGLDIPVDKVYQAINQPQGHFFANLGFPEKLWAGLIKEYTNNFGNYSCPVFSGIPELLSNLRNKKKILGLATFNMLPNVERLFGEHLDNFTHITTQSDARVKSEGLKKIIAKTGLPPKQHRLIGDTLWDVKDADDAGVSFVGVGWGWHKLETCSDYFAAKTPQELYGFLMKN